MKYMVFFPEKLVLQKPTFGFSLISRASFDNKQTKLVKSYNQSNF